MKIKAGQLVAFTNGEYSDYCLRDHMRALVDIDSTELVERFKQETGPSNRKWSTGEDRPGYDDVVFMAWLIRAGVFEPVDDVLEWNTGGYGNFTEDKYLMAVEPRGL